LNPSIKKVKNLPAASALSREEAQPMADDSDKKTISKNEIKSIESPLSLSKKNLSKFIFSPNDEREKEDIEREKGMYYGQKGDGSLRKERWVKNWE